MRTAVSAATLALLFVAVAAAQDQPLEISKVVVYKHGVGYFEREGTVRGDQRVELAFKASEMKDLLKSLYAVDLAGGRIASITYDTKDPLSKQLEDIVIRVPEGNALTAFLRGLQGARVRVTDRGRAVSGSVLGLEPVAEKTETGTTTTYKLLLMLEDGAIRPVELLSIGDLRLLDAALQRDLERMLAIRMRAKHSDRKTVVLDATGEGERRIRVGYVVEQPIWKTTYRLLFQEDRKPLLQGWAILENTTDEDWENVDVSFVAGSPISFVMDLYTAYYPERSEIPVGTTAAPGASLGQLQGRLEDARRKSRARRPQAPRGGATFGVDEEAEVADKDAALAEELEKAVAPAAAGVQVGELFAYHAREKVSVRRRQAALVPILSERVDGSERVVYYRRSISQRPMNAWRFTNGTELTLESGPVTFFDGSTCIGEGLFRRVLKPGMTEIAPYAVEPAVTVGLKVDRRSDPYTSGRVMNGVLVLTRTQNLETVYDLKSRLEDDAVLYVDHAKAPGFELAEPKSAEDEVEGHHRFRVPLPAGGRREFRVRETRPVTTELKLLQTEADVIRLHVSRPYLSERTRAFLRDLLELQAAVSEVGQDAEELAQERGRLQEDQERVRRNLAVFRQTPEELRLRQKYLERLDANETRLEAIRAELERKMAERQQLQRRIVALVSGFDER